MMTLQQTVEIPADHRLFIDVPEEIPAGKATFRLEWIKPPAKPAAEEAIEALCGLYAGVDTLDAYMERRHTENRSLGRKPPLAQTTEALWELCKDASLTVDSFLEERHKEAEREEAEYRE